MHRFDNRPQEFEQAVKVFDRVLFMRSPITLRKTSTLLRDFAYGHQVGLFGTYLNRSSGQTPPEFSIKIATSFGHFGGGILDLIGPQNSNAI